MLFPLLPCVLFGGIVGFFMGEDAKIFAPIGNIFINAVFTLVVPLIATSIIRAITSTKDTKRLGKVFKISLFVFFITSLFSSLVMTTIVSFIPAAQKMNLPFSKEIAAQSRSLADIMVSILSVPDFVDILSRSNMLPMLIFSIGIGLATLLVGSAGKAFSQLIESANMVLIRLNKMVMMAAPIGLGAYFATLTGLALVSILLGTILVRQASIGDLASSIL
jgi:Na+/H+-dicarboxylate symporter